LERAGLSKTEGVIIHKPSNIYYLSGYTGEGLLVFGHGFKAIITDFRYTEQAENQAPGFQVLMVGKGVSHVMLAKKVFDENGVTAARFEDDEVTVRAFRKMEEALLPQGTDYMEISGLRIEARQKLTRQQPVSLGQAARIPGVSPGDISVLMIWLEKNRRGQDGK